jgi:hypothetical protein
MERIMKTITIRKKESGATVRHFDEIFGIGEAVTGECFFLEGKNKDYIFALKDDEYMEILKK